jgi:hypothetical protein
MAWLTRHRVVLGVAAVVVVVLSGGGYVAWTASRQHTPPAAASAPVSGGLLFIDQRGGQNSVARLEAGGTTSATGQRCQRVYAAAGTTVCLRLAGVGPSYEAAVLGDTERTVPLPGVPSRARVSASGSVVSWTVFVTGDSYAVPGAFSTRTGVLDLRTGTLLESLEGFTAYVDGAPYARADINYWGVTVAADDRTFYATMASAGKTWLVRGDLVERTVRSMRTNAECPSLSPDGTKVAYKKRAGRLGAWQLFVLDLATGVETPLPGTSGLDDQAAWLDDETLAYAKLPTGAGAPSIFTTRVDGTGEPSLLIADASSPSPLR